MLAESETAVLVAQTGECLEITLNRPHRRNAVDQSLSEGVAAALDRLDSDPGLRVAIITGAGNGFCSGMDLSAYEESGVPWVEGRGFAGITQRCSNKPVIAAVERFALAGGLEVALACDLIVAGRDAKLGIPEVQRGLIATAGALGRLPRRIPYHLAMELALTGQPVTAERAYEFGLINRVVEPGAAMDAARELAKAVALNAPLALAASKTLIQGASDWTEQEAWVEQQRLGAIVNGSEDAKEGARAFLEKRPANWHGR